MIILASKSPRRRQILTEAGIEFKSIPSEINEKSRYIRPKSIVKDLALKKAMDVALRNPDFPVLGSDTLVYCKKEILGKPKNHDDALRMLKMQNNSWQAVYTGVALVWISKKIVLSDARVSFCKARNLSESELKAIAVKHLDKAGAYAVQDKNDKFIKTIKGRFDNIVGLPMDLVLEFLKKVNVFVRAEIKS